MLPTVLEEAGSNQDNGKQSLALSKFVQVLWSGYRYALTHIPSGIKVTDCRLQRTAKLIADDLNHPGWNTEKGTLPHFTVLEAAKPILAKYCNQ